MGCGHSKINIYPRKSKGKNSSKKSGGSGSSHSSNGGGTVRGGGGTNGYTTSNGACEDGGQQTGGSDDETQRTIDGGGNNNSEELQPLQQDDTDGGDSGGTKVKLKPHTIGGPLLAHSEISESQQNFFRMLDEKIENGPDYDSSSEIEQMKENERLTTLLQDWETASAASRSLPSTPRHYPHQHNTQQHYPQQHPHPQQHVILQHQSSITGSNKHHPHHTPQTMGPMPQNHQNYMPNTAAIPKQQIIHQPAMTMLHHHHPAYGGPPVVGSTTIHNPAFQTYSPPTHHHTGNPLPTQQPHSAPPLTVFSKVVPGMQYTESLSLNSQIKQNLTNFVAQRQLQLVAAQQAHAVQHYHHPMSMVAPRDVSAMVQNYSNTYSNTSQSSSSQVISSPIHKHSRIPSANIQSTPQQPVPQMVRQNSGNIVYSAALPQHSTISMYPSSASSAAASQQSPSAQSGINPDYTNGELILQQQLYNQQLKSHLSKEIQQYKQSREQLLIKQQQQQEQQILVQTQHAMVAQHNKPTRIMPPNPQQQQQQSYQSSVEMSINRTATTGTDPMSPKMMYRKQNSSSSTATTRQYSQEMT